MNIALAQTEIAQFLECSVHSVPVLWAHQDMSRSIFVDHRYTAELSHSSVFDVLEYFLTAEVLPEPTNPSDVDAWLCAIEELVETEDWGRGSLEDTVFALMRIYEDFAGAPCPPVELAVRATKALTAYLALLRFVEADTMSILRKMNAG